MAEAEKIMNFIMSGVAPEPAKKKIVVKKAAEKEPEVKEEEAPKVEKEPEAQAPQEESVEKKDDAPKQESAPKQEEAPKQESAEIKEPEGDKKVEAEPKEEAKTQKAPETKKKRPSLIKEVSPVTIKRSGLKIVKKRKPKVEENFSTPSRGSEAAKVSNYGKISQDVLEELAAKKSRRKNQQNLAVQKKNQGTSLNIFGGGMSDVSMDYEEDQVVLLDLNEVDRVIPEEQPHKPRAKKPAGRNAGKKQGGPRKPRQVSRANVKNTQKQNRLMRL